MKFKKFINEESLFSDQYDEISDQIIKLCPKYIKEMVPTDYSLMKILWSGRSDNRITFIKDVRADRRPTDTSIELHNWLDGKFQKKFGFKARSNALFVTGSYGTAANYGSSVYSIWPIGDYKYLYNENVNDLYVSMMEKGMPEAEYKRWIEYEIVMKPDKDLALYIKKYLRNSKLTDQEALDSIDRIYTPLIEHLEDDKYKIKEWQMIKAEEWWKNNSSGYKTTGLKSALPKVREVMLNCKSYIAVKGVVNSENIADIIRDKVR